MHRRFADKNIIEGTNLAAIKSDKPLVNNKSGYKGVCFHKGRQKYLAQIWFKGTHYHLGYYSDPKEASIAYENAKDKLHRKFLDDQNAKPSLP